MHMQGLGLGGNLLTGGLGPLRECGQLLQGLSLAGNQVSELVSTVREEYEGMNMSCG